MAPAGRVTDTCPPPALCNIAEIGSLTLYFPFAIRALLRRVSEWRQFCRQNKRGGKPYVLHQLETLVTLCTIENTLIVPLLVLYVPSVISEEPRLSRGVSHTRKER